MIKSDSSLKIILNSAQKPAIPNDLSERVFVAVKMTQKKQEKIRHITHTTSLALLSAFFIASVLPVVVSFFAGNLHEVLSTALENSDIIPFSDIAMAIAENLPFLNITATCITIAAISYLLSKKKKTNPLIFKHS